MKIFNNKKLKIRRSASAGNQGLTLVELLVVIGVFGIILMVTGSTMSAYFRNRKMIKKFQESSEEISLALNYLTKDVRMSNCGDAVCGCVAAAGESQAISFCENSSYVSAVNPGQRVVYGFAGNELTRNGEVIASDVNGHFYSTGGLIKRYTIVIWKNGQADRSFQSTVSARGGYK